LLSDGNSICRLSIFNSNDRRALPSLTNNDNQHFNAFKMQILLCQIERNAAKKGKNQVWLSLNIFLPSDGNSIFRLSVFNSNDRRILRSLSNNDNQHFNAFKMQIPVCQIKRNPAKKGKIQVWLSLNIVCLVMVTPFVD
jgi:hypothetical protein